MTTIVRLAVDIEVEGGDPQEVENAIREGRIQVGNFAKDAIVRTDENVDTGNLVMTTLGGGAHVHDASGGFCDMCDRYSRVHVLP